MFFVRLSRIVPLLIALGVLAAIVYLVVAAISSPPKAKEVLIKLFTVIMSVLSVVFGLFTLYAVFEGNTPVLELAASFLAVAVIGLVTVRIANRVFLKNNPSYRAKPVHATTKHRWRWPR